MDATRMVMTASVQSALAMLSPEQQYAAIAAALSEFAEHAGMSDDEAIGVLVHHAGRGNASSVNGFVSPDPSDFGELQISDHSSNAALWRMGAVEDDTHYFVLANRNGEPQSDRIQGEVEAKRQWTRLIAQREHDHGGDFDDDAC